MKGKLIKTDVNEYFVYWLEKRDGDRINRVLLLHPCDTTKLSMSRYPYSDQSEVDFIITEVDDIKYAKIMDESELYSTIESEIIIWSNDGTKTAGHLTRKIMDLISKLKEDEN